MYCGSVNVFKFYTIVELYFSLTALNMAWCCLDSECMTLLCKTLPASIIRLNIAGCRKTMTDDSKYVMNCVIYPLSHAYIYLKNIYSFVNFRCERLVEKMSSYYRIRLE